MNDEFSHQFVEFIPKALDPRTLYVSVQHAVAVHLCACGCGEKVVTPLAPIHWKITFDGRSISLYPSIGNHAFACKSHYWLEDGCVRWSYAMSDESIARVRSHAKKAQQSFYNEKQDRPELPVETDSLTKIPTKNSKIGLPWWKRLFG